MLQVSSNKRCSELVALVLIRAGSDPAYLRSAAAQTLERLHDCIETGQPQG